MPYVTSEARNRLQEDTERLSNKCRTVGELNFVITVVLHRWLYDHGISYDEVNKLSGVISCVSKEFYAMVARPYEDQKIIENGDIILLGNKIK